MVGLFRGVHDRMGADGGDAVLDSSRKAMGESKGEAAEIGFVSSAGKGTAKRSLPAETLADPANGFGFNLEGQLRARRRGKLRIDRRNQGLGEYGCVRGSGIHQAKVVGRGNVETLVNKLSGIFPKEFRERIGCVGSRFVEYSGFGQRIAQRFERALLERKLYRAHRQGFEIGIDNVNEFVAEAAAGLRVEGKGRVRHVKIVKVHGGRCDDQCCASRSATSLSKTDTSVAPRYFFTMRPSRSMRKLTGRPRMPPK